jgi:hypothetical protein
MKIIVCYISFWQLFSMFLKSFSVHLACSVGSRTWSYRTPGRFPTNILLFLDDFSISTRVSHFRGLFPINISVTFLDLAFSVGRETERLWSSTSEPDGFLNDSFPAFNIECAAKDSGR